jgi:hypothetical protein
MGRNILEKFQLILQMNKIVDHSIPILCCVYYLLIAYGVVKLPPQRQQKFDALLQKRKTLYVVAAYVIIALSIFWMVWDLS